MSALLVSVIALLQNVQSDAADAPQLRPRPPANTCTCSVDTPPPDIIFEGVAIDAELRANADGRDFNPLQATIFRVTRRIVGSVEDPAKVWHITDTMKCGVRFDYGRKYFIRARKVKSGIETDACLMSGEYRGVIE